MRILFVGDTVPSSTSRHRADALCRMGHDVVLADPYAAISGRLRGRFRSALHFHSGYRLLQTGMCRWINDLIQKYDTYPPDLIWVNGGELLGRESASMLRRFICPIVLYNNDDPTGKRDGRRFDSLIKSLPVYDLCVVLRNQNIREYLDRGAHAAHRVWMSYDEVMHQPFDNPLEIPSRFQSDVAFVGTWMRSEARDWFLLSLIERGVNVAIWGNRWHKAPTWRQLQPYWRGPALSGNDYVAAIQGAKISLGFLSHGNRDLHTRRSMEIPYAGGLLCAERTSEHIELYQENEEAVFWSDANECADQCLNLLADPEKRERIRLAGMRRVRENKVGNEDICRQIISAVFS